VDRRELDVHDGGLGKTPRSRRIAARLEPLDGRTDLHVGGEPGVEARTEPAAEIRELPQGDQDLDAVGPCFQVPDAVDEALVEILRIDEGETRALRVGIRDHQRGTGLASVAETHAASVTILDQDPVDRHAGPDLHPVGLGRPGHRLGHPSHAALGDSAVLGLAEDAAPDVGDGKDAAGRAGVAGVLRVDEYALTRGSSKCSSIRSRTGTVTIVSQTASSAVPRTSAAT
jgi:hypothetical protein